jgi:aminomethyltransferase
VAHVGVTGFTGTPFNARTAPLNVLQRWTAWDVYHVVDVFTDVAEELRSIRERAAMIDMSPLAKYEVRGADAERFVDHVVTRDVTTMVDGQVFYTPWCDDAGRIVSDGMVFRIDRSRFRITGDPSERWLRRHVDPFDVELVDITHDRGILAVQGPRSQEVVARLLAPRWEPMRFSRTRSFELDGFEVEVSRQGFTGEHGYELCVEREHGPALWDAVVDAGAGHGLLPAGFVASDIARIEAGLVIPGPDYTKGGLDDDRGAAVEVQAQNTVTPYEIGIGRLVDLDGAPFLGRGALAAERDRGPATRMVGLLVDWQPIADLFTGQGLPPVVVPTPMWYPCRVQVGGRDAGRATSLAWSPARRSIAGFGFLAVEYSRPGTEVTVVFDVAGTSGPVRAVVVDLPHLARRRAA